MIALVWVALALAGADAEQQAALQRVAALEWARAAPGELVRELVGAGPEVRARVAWALARLEDPDALEPLLALRDDPDPRVRLAVAEGLSLVEGAGSAAAAWLVQLEPPRGRAARALADDGLRVRLIEALGRQGASGEAERLRTELQRPWPDGEAAARAMGWLLERDVLEAGEGQAVVEALVQALDGTDRRVVRGAAIALERADLGERPDLTYQAYRVARTSRDGPTRARLLGAIWPALPPEARQGLFLDGVSSPWRQVRVAALQALEPGDLDPAVVGSWLAAPDPWLRWAALDALGRMAVAGEPADDLLELARGPDPWVARAAERWLLQEEGGEDRVPVQAGGAAPPIEPPTLEAIGGVRGAVMHTDRGRFTLRLDPHIAPLAVHALIASAPDDERGPWTVEQLEPARFVSLPLPGGAVVPERHATTPRAGHVCLIGGPAPELRLATGDWGAGEVRCSPVGEVVQGMDVVARLQPGDRVHLLTFERVP